MSGAGHGYAVFVLLVLTSSCGRVHYENAACGLELAHMGGSCVDGVDNDCDGLVDEDDLGCAPEIPFETIFASAPIPLYTPSSGTGAFGFADLTSPNGGPPDGLADLVIGPAAGTVPFELVVLARVRAEFASGDYVLADTLAQHVENNVVRSIAIGPYGLDGRPSLFAIGNNRGIDNVFAWDGAAYVDLASSGCTSDDDLFGAYPDGEMTTFALPLIDYDLDGDHDLYRLNGGYSSNELLTQVGIDGDVPCFARSVDSSSAHYVPEEGRGASVADVDRDGDPDLVSVGFVSRLFMNETAQADDASFVPLDVDLNPSDELGAVDFHQAATYLDFENDGDLDLMTTHWTGSVNRLFRNQLTETGSFSFTDATTPELAAADMDNVTGAYPGDIDNDGDLDLFFTSHALPGNVHANRLLRNDLLSPRSDATTTASFVRTNVDAVSMTGSASYWSNFYDHDGDGDLDLLISNARMGDPPSPGLFLLRNEYYERGGTSYYYRCRVVVNGRTNWLGTKVEITFGAHRQLRELLPYEGFGVSTGPDMHFGLGRHSRVDSVKIYLPGDTEPALLLSDVPAMRGPAPVDVITLSR